MSDEKKIGNIADIKINVGVASVLLLLWLFLSSLYVLLEEHRSFLIYSTSIIAGVATIYIAYYTATIAVVNIKRDKYARAFGLISELNKEEVVIYRQMFYDLDRRNIAENAIVTQILADRLLTMGAIKILSMLDDIAIAVRHGFADEDILKDSLGFFAPYYFKLLKPYIDNERKSENDQSIYKELEVLVAAWSHVDQKKADK